MTDDHKSAAQIIDLYERHAQSYDHDRARSTMERPWLDRLIERLPKHGRVLDIGCGMGEPIAAYLIECGLRVTGVDASSSLIALCRARFPDHEWIVGDMRALALNQRFDAILAWDSFFHLTMDDQRAMFSRFADHAQPGAPLMFTSGPRAGTAMGEYHGEPLHHASLAPEEYRALLAQNGFGVTAFEPDDESCGGHTIWLAASTFA